MAIPLTGSNSLFVRIGHHGGALNSHHAWIGATTFGPAVDTIRGDYSTSNQDLVDGIYSMRDAYRDAHGSLTSYLKDLASETLIQMADDDVRLVTLDVTTALKELISQMEDSSDDVEASTASVSVSAGSGNTGNAVVAASVVGPDGKTLQYLFDEVLELTITGDSQTETATAGSEPASLLGEPLVEDPLAWDWPKGSGASTSLTLIDASLDNNGNLLTNSDFSDFTVTDTPDNWTLVTATPSTTLFASGSGDAYDGTGNALKITGTGGAELTHLVQIFNSASGTLGKLLPQTVYAVNLFTKVSAVPAAGALRIALVNSGNTVINDDAGTANSTTIDLTAETASYASHTAFFRTPSVLPSSVRLEIKMTTAIESGKSVFVDHLAFAEATQAYTGGVYVAAFSGSTEVVIDDKWNIDVTSTPGAFQKLFERFFGMRELGLTLPFDAAPTIDDALVTL